MSVSKNSSCSLLVSRIQNILSNKQWMSALTKFNSNKLTGQIAFYYQHNYIYSPSQQENSQCLYNLSY